MHGAFLLDYGIRLRVFMSTMQGKGIRLVALSCLGVDHRIQHGHESENDNETEHQSSPLGTRGYTPRLATAFTSGMELVFGPRKARVWPSLVE